MTTIRLTAAQAMVRFLSAQRVEIDGSKTAPVRGRVRDFRPRQRGGHRRSALRRARRPPHLPRPQRTGDGPCRDRLRQSLAPQAHDGLYILDRPRRDQHGHSGGDGACQPPAGSADTGRRLRQPQARSGSAAGRGLRRRNDERQRLLPSRVAVFRPHRAPRADRAGAEPGDRAADRSGGVRAGDPRLLPGRADGGLRLSGKLLRRARAPPAARRARPARGGRSRGAFENGQEAVRDLRRRGPLFRRGARTDRLLRPTGRSGRRDAGRQVRDSGRPSLGHGRGRRDRNRRGQHARFSKRT